MNPAVPGLLSDVLAAAEKTLAAPGNDPRRLDQLERLIDRVDEAMQWGTDQPRRFVNDWTLMLLKMVRKLERLGPFGDGDEAPRARTLAVMLTDFVRADAGQALEVTARAPLPDSDRRAGR